MTNHKSHYFLVDEDFRERLSVVCMMYLKLQFFCCCAFVVVKWKKNTEKVEEDNGEVHRIVGYHDIAASINILYDSMR